MKKVAVVILFLVVMSCTSQRDYLDYNEHKLNVDFISSKFKVYYDMDQIPSSFLKYKKSHERSSLTLVNPGENYNTTDLHYQGEKNAELVLYGESKGGIGILLYKMGGYYGEHKRCDIFREISKNRYISLHYILDYNVVDIEGIKLYVKNKIQSIRR